MTLALTSRIRSLNKKIYVGGLFGVYFIFTSFVKRYFKQERESSNITSRIVQVSESPTDNSVNILSILLGHLLSKRTATNC